jgi:hypothetical protein
LEQGKVEVDEMNLGFCLIHVFIMFMPCGFLDVLGIYRLLKKDNQITNMAKLGAKYVVVYPNLCIQYEQDMAKSIIFLDYYHNVYEGWYKHW